jgi:predicted TIM-barrel fold metal-dependent hydrolase
VKVSAFYALGRKQPPHLELVPMIKRLYETFGPQRLMWASDCPYQLQKGNSYRASISLVRDKLDFVSAEDRQWLLRKTAEKVFFFR